MKQENISLKQNDFMNKKHKKFIKLNYIEQLLILASVVTGCVPISSFASLLSIPIGIASSVVRLEIFAITAGIKKYISIMRMSINNNNSVNDVIVKRVICREVFIVHG